MHELQTCEIPSLWSASSSLWSAPPAAGIIAAALVGLYYGLSGQDPGFAVVVAFAGGFVLVGGATTLLSGVGGSMAGTIYHPSAESTPVKREYSYPESLAARGHYEDAINAYQVCCADHPEDPEPYVRIARLYRDQLHMYDEALLWFKRARSESALSSGRELLITQEIIEIFTRRIGDPQRAIPELARLVDRFPDDPACEWAKEQIVKLRQEREAEENGFPR